MLVDNSTSLCYTPPANKGGFPMNQRFDAFVTGITVCYKYIQRIKSAEVNDMGLRVPTS